MQKNVDCFFDIKKVKKSKKLLIVGAGGIGVEIIKLLQKMEDFLIFHQITNLTIIDNDFIEISNLNRQFIFQKEDINKNKSEICANFLKKSFSEKIKINYFVEKISNESQFDIQFLQKYDIILNGLDNLFTRKYILNRVFLINQILCKNILTIDGGSMGFNGQVRCFVNECYECLNIKEVSEVIPVCTVKGKPEKYEHALIWALNRFDDILENKEKNFIKNKYKEGLLKEIENKKYDNLKNERQKTSLIFLLANYQCDKFNIKKRMSLLETENSIKKIVPSISTINSLIASLILKNLMTFLKNRVKYNFVIANSKIMKNSEIIENLDCNFCKIKRIHLKTRMKNGMFILNVEEIEDLKEFLNVKKFSLFDFELSDFFLEVKKNNSEILSLNSNNIYILQEKEKYLLFIEEIKEDEDFDIKFL